MSLSEQHGQTATAFIVYMSRNYMTEPHTTEPSAVSHNPLFIPSCLATFIYINTRRFHLDSADNLKERGRGD